MSADNSERQSSPRGTSEIVVTWNSLTLIKLLLLLLFLLPYLIKNLISTVTFYIMCSGHTHHPTFSYLPLISPNPLLLLVSLFLFIMSFCIHFYFCFMIHRAYLGPHTWAWEWSYLLVHGQLISVYSTEGSDYPLNSQQLLLTYFKIWGTRSHSSLLKAP